MINIRLRPEIATPLATHRHIGPLRPNVTSSIKPEVHNISQRRRRRTEPQPQGIRTTNFAKIGSAVPEICSRTDRQTHRQTDKLVTILRSRTWAEQWSHSVCVLADAVASIVCRYHSDTGWRCASGLECLTSAALTAVSRVALLPRSIIDFTAD